MKKLINSIMKRTPILRGIWKQAAAKNQPLKSAPESDKKKKKTPSASKAPKKPPTPFPGSEAFWESRYAEGGNSGVGSYGFFAEFKAEVLNQFVADRQVQSVIEFGCGDGNQLGLAKYPKYLGFDVSSTAVAKCRELYQNDPSKSFRLVGEYQPEHDKADLTLSLDVIFHLVEDSVFEDYMRRLFGASQRYVIVFSSNTDDNSRFDGEHVRHRAFTQWVEANLGDWKLIQHVPNRHPFQGDYRTGSFADFFIFEKV